MSTLWFQVDHIPDLSLSKYQSLSDSGVDGVLKKHEQFLRQWHGICKESGTSFHLLYEFLPAEPTGNRLKLCLGLRGSDRALERVTPLLATSPLSEFYSFRQVPESTQVYGAGATLIKQEHMHSPYNSLTGEKTAIHYVPQWKMNEEARLYDLMRMMETIALSYEVPAPCAFRVDVYPASEIQKTRECFLPVFETLRGENEIRLVKDVEGLTQNSYVRDICKEYEDWLTNIETTPHFRVNMYAFAGDTFQAKVLLNAAGAEALSEGNYTVNPIKPDADGQYSSKSRLSETAAVYCAYLQETTLKKLETWSTTYTLNELAPFFRLPALFDGEEIEIPKETRIIPDTSGLYLGKDTNGFGVYFPVKELAKHAFFTGMPGSGKTNTMLHLLTQLKQKGIPFLALEPAKKEYRALLRDQQMRDVYLFSPHLGSWFPLQMNPFQFPKNVRVSEHINALLEVFEGSFVLEGPTYKLLSSAIQHAYQEYGWDLEDINDGTQELSFPRLQDVYDHLEQEIRNTTYESDIKGNIQAFLQVRLGGLMDRDAGEIFNVQYSTLDPEEWLESSAIVELEVLGEQAKNFFILLVCQYIFESLRADPTGGTAPNGTTRALRHAVFIEEAHNIIASSAQQDNDSVNPKVSATAYLMKMLAEVRALREGMIIADQLPTALTSEVTKNTGLKLVHRLTSQDDREQIGTAISASALQLEKMAGFSQGRALIHYEKTPKPFEVQIAEWVIPEVSYDHTRDQELFLQFVTGKTVFRAQNTELYNWKECQLLLFSDILSQWEKDYLHYISSDDHDADRYFALDRRRKQISKQYSRLKKQFARRKERWSYLAAIDPEFSDDLAEISDYIEGLRDNLEIHL